MTVRNAAGSRPLVAPVFLPHAGCPHRCLFCNQSAITGAAARSPDPERTAAQIESFLAGARTRPVVEIAFYGGSFLGQPPEVVRGWLRMAGGFVSAGRAGGIRFSTRPDTVDAPRLDAIAPFPVDVVEVGAQSLDDRVLDRCRRGHSASDTAAAVKRLRLRGYRVGLQLMVGLPGQSAASALASAAEAAALGPDFVRIYPTVVLAGSPLARRHRRGRFRPLGLDEAVSQTADMVEIFSFHRIPVVRMGLQATEGLSPGAQVLDGPCHPAFGELVRSAVWRRRLEQAVGAGSGAGGLRIWTNPRTESQIRGQRNRNLSLLQRRLDRPSVSVIKDVGLDPETIRVEADGKMQQVAFCGR